MHTHPDSSASPPSAQPIPERELAVQLGVSRADLQKLRGGLIEGEHWQGGQGSPIVILPAGIEALHARLSHDKKEGVASALSDAAKASQTHSGYESLIIVRIGSKTILLAKKEGGADLIRVQVRSTALFLPGMRLERCRRSPADASVAYYHGRYPRRRGTF